MGETAERASLAEIPLVRKDSIQIRPFEKGDRSDVLSLYQKVLSSHYSKKWFKWKFEDNPYTENAPLIVAATSGSIVGAAGFWPLKYAIGTDTIDVIQPCDGAVDPAYRRRGIYSDIFARGLHEASVSGAQCAFDFPNELSRKTFEKYGWQLVSARNEWRLLQRPSAFVSRINGKWIDTLVSPLISLSGNGKRLTTAMESIIDPTPIDIVSFDGIPSELFQELYRTSPPSRIHAYRDEQFYRWRFNNPLAIYRSYVVYEHGRPEAGLVLGIRQNTDRTVAEIVDIEPLGGVDQRMLESLLSVVIQENSAADVIQVTGNAFPADILRQWGFLPDNRFPLSLATKRTVHGVHPLDNSWNIHGLDMRDPDSWDLNYIDYDTR